MFSVWLLFLGLLPPAPICVPLVNREMQRCYTKVGFSPDMFISNDSNVEGAVIGKDFNSANKFCGYVYLDIKLLKTSF